MSVDLGLLSSTDNRALGAVAYGAGGMEKTFAVRTLPPPILHLDFEGGVGPLQPWLRRSRKWNTNTWTTYSDEQRAAAFDMVAKPLRERYRIAPRPYVDVVSFDNLAAASWDEATQMVGNFDTRAYSSISLDSLQESSVGSQTYAKAKEGEPVDALMRVKLWGPAQERLAIILRKLRNFREHGVFVYLIAQELIDKDYVTDPRSVKPGEAPQEPFSVKGTAAVPGQLTNTVQHMTDLMFHVRMFNGRPAWVTKPEPISPGSGAFWEAKDRYGRIAEPYVFPNFREVFKSVYGAETAGAIYQSGSVVKD